MYTLMIITGITILLGIAIWGYAYRLGLRHGRATSVPFRLIDELLDHKIYCCGQDPSIARFELEQSLGIEAWESQSLVQHVLYPSRRAHNRNENPDLPLESSSEKVT